MKITIKDIFSNSSAAPEQEKPAKSTEKDRMVQLVKSFEQKDVIIKEEKESIVNQEKVQKEIDRIKEVVRLNEWGSVNQFTGNIPTTIGFGQTVNSFIDPKATTVNTAFNTNPNSMKVHNPNYTYLSDAEALRLAISRALNSGDPTVTKLGFYEEVNQILNGLGFMVKSPLDIKQMVIKMVNR